MPQDPAPWRSVLRHVTTRIAAAGLSVARVNSTDFLRWPTALAAAVSIATPAVVGSLLGRPHWGLVAAGGGFLAVYMPDRGRLDRRAVLPLLGLVMVLCAAIGVATSRTVPLSIAGMWVATLFAAWACARLRVGVPGPLMPVLIAGIAGRAAAPRSLGGLEMAGTLVVGMVGAGLVLALAVASAPRPRSSHLVEAEGRGARSRAENPRVRRIHLDVDAARIVRRIAVAATVLAVTMVLVPMGAPYWLFLTAVAVLQALPGRRLTMLRGIHRVLGTIVGIWVFTWFEPVNLPPVVLGLVLGGLQFGVEVLAPRHYGLALVLVTPGALLLTAGISPSKEAAVAGVRLVDTLVGAGVALSVVALEALTDRLVQRRRSV